MELKLRTPPEEAYAEELVRLMVRTRMLDFMQVQFSSDTQDEVFTSLWIKKFEVLVGDAEIIVRKHRCHVLRSLKLSAVRSCRSSSFGEVLWITRRQSQLESEPCEAGWSNPSRRHGSQD